MLFRNKSREELLELIDDLEAQVATGVQSVAYAGGASVTNVSVGQATTILRHLHAALDRKDGKAPATGRAFVVVPSNRAF